MMAFNIKQGIHEFSPDELNIKWEADLENARYVMEELKTVNPKDVDLSEPINVIYENGKLWVDDGHHRWLSAKLTGRKLKGDLVIKDNPIKKILADQEKFKSSGNPRQNFQERVIAGQDFIDEVKSVGRSKRINPDGTITLYHGSSPQNIQNIRKAGLRDQSFLSLTKDETIEHIHQHGKKEVLMMNVDARDVEFSTGSQEIYVPEGLVIDVDGIWKSPQRIKKELA